jgi:hypothetical protein
MNTYVIRGVLVFGLIMVVTGCSHYYRVTDPASGKTFYATEIHEARGGAVKIKDERTRSTVTLQDLDATLALASRLAEGIQVLPTALPHVVETFEALVVFCQAGRQPGTADEVAALIILGDKSAEQPVEVLHRLDETEHPVVPVVDADVLESRSQAWRG